MRTIRKAEKYRVKVNVSDHISEIIVISNRNAFDIVQKQTAPAAIYFVKRFGVGNQEIFELWLEFKPERSAMSLKFEFQTLGNEFYDLILKPLELFGVIESKLTEKRINGFRAPTGSGKHPCSINLSRSDFHQSPEFDYL